MEFIFLTVIYPRCNSVLSEGRHSRCLWFRASNWPLPKFLPHPLGLWEPWYKDKGRKEAGKRLTCSRCSVWLNKVSFLFQPTAEDVLHRLLYSRDNLNETNWGQVKRLHKCHFKVCFLEEPWDLCHMVSQRSIALSKSFLLIWVFTFACRPFCWLTLQWLLITFPDTGEMF